MNYNINGILIEPEAFNKLKTELKMRSIENPILEFRGNRLYASRFPDTQGNYHPIIVREAQVQQYDPDLMYIEAENIPNRTYYEVVYDKHIIDQLTAASRNKRMKKTAL